jgi:hypothetical protein
METELRFDGALHFADRRAEDDFIKFLHHLAGAEGAEGSAFAAGGTGRMHFRQFGEIRAIYNLFFEVVALFFGADENMSCCCLSHGNLLWVVEKPYPACFETKIKASTKEEFAHLKR